MSSMIIKHSPAWFIIAWENIVDLEKIHTMFFPMTYELSIFCLYMQGFEEINGEGNGKPLQYSCLENPMDGEAW